MKFNQRKIDQANEILDFLKTQWDYKADTSSIMRKLGMGMSNNGGRDKLIEVLEYLRIGDHLIKMGKRKFLWKLKDPYGDRDRNNPFKLVPDGYTPPPPSKEDDHPPVEEDDDVKILHEELPKEHTFPELHQDNDFRLQLKTVREEVKNLQTLTQGLNSLTELQEEKIKKLEEELKEAKRTVEAQVKRIEIVRKKGDGKEEVVTLKNVILPAVFQDVMDLAEERMNILLVGPAGCGKTHLGKLVAKALKLKFGYIGCTAGTTEIHFLGRSIPNIKTGEGHFQGTEFLSMFEEEGGAFLADEADAMDANTFLCLNAGLANGYLAVPNRPEKPRSERHEDFIFMGTANTTGRGANRQYSGRNQLDESTLDRFRVGVVECDYDPIVEAKLCPNEELRGKLQRIRNKCQEHGFKRIISTRFLMDSYKMFKAKERWNVDKCVKQLIQGWSNEEKEVALGA